MGVHRASAEIFFPALADGAISFEHQPEGIETRMATGAGFVFAMFGQRFAQRKITKTFFVGGQFGNNRGRRRNAFAQHPADHPVTALHRTRAQAG